ncbi:hypothetical protein Tco_0635708 [Tanacetum coccineum]
MNPGSSRIPNDDEDGDDQDGNDKDGNDKDGNGNNEDGIGSDESSLASDAECYTMLQELRSMIVGGALIHKNHEGSKLEGQRIHPIIGDFGGNCASNQSPFNNGRIDECINNLVSRKLVDFLKLPMEICPIEGYQVCRVPMTIEKSYKVVLYIVDDIDECHILLEKPWRCEVNGKYDGKRNLYLFSWEGRKIAMVPPKVTPQLLKADVKVEEKIMKAEVVDEHIEKVQDLQTYKQHDDNISTLSFGTTNTISTLMTCEEIIGFNDDKDVKSLNCFRVDVKRKSIEDKVRREKVFEVDEALNIDNSRTSSFQVRGINVDETKVNVVRDWSSPKTLPEVRNNKVENVFQEYELEYAEPLDGEAEQVTYVIQHTLCSPKVSEDQKQGKESEKHFGGKLPVGTGSSSRISPEPNQDYCTREQITEIIRQEVADKERWKKAAEEASQQADLAKKRADLAKKQAESANERAARTVSAPIPDPYSDPNRYYKVVNPGSSRIPNDDEDGDDQDGNDKDGNGNNEDGIGSDESSSASDAE